MCLIGAAFPRNGAYLLFKNRDLEDRPILPNPKVVTNVDTKSQNRIIFSTSIDGSQGIWGRVNEYGPSMQFADIYIPEIPYIRQRNFMRIKERPLESYMKMH